MNRTPHGYASVAVWPPVIADVERPLLAAKRQAH
jgi:hypothetical protein